MGLAILPDSPDDRVHFIALATGMALYVALVTWRADTVYRVYFGSFSNSYRTL